MTLIQIFLIVFALFAMTRVIIQFRKGALSLAVLFLWILFWALVGVVVLLPKTTDVFAQLVGVGRGVDAIMYMAILALFYLVFRLYVAIEHIEQEITRFVRAMAAQSSKKQNDQESS